MNNKIVNFDKSDVYTFLKYILIPNRKELIFILLTLIIPISGAILYIYYSDYDLKIPQSNYSNFVIVVYLIIILLMYKFVTKATKWDAYKVLAQFFILIALGGIITGIIFVLPYSKSPLSFIFIEIIDKFSFIITGLFTLLGFINFFYWKKWDWKEFLLLYTMSLAISVSFDLLDSYAKSGVIAELSYMRIFLNGFSGVIYLFAYREIQNYISIKHKELFVFGLIGILVFVINFLSGVITHITNLLYISPDELFSIIGINLIDGGVWFAYGLVIYYYNNKLITLFKS